jgi:hypothetical protein
MVGLRPASGGFLHTYSLCCCASQNAFPARQDGASMRIRCARFGRARAGVCSHFRHFHLDVQTRIGENWCIAMRIIHEYVCTAAMAATFSR